MAAEPVDASTFTPDLLASLLADGDDELAAWTLRNALAERSRARVFDGLLRDAMTLVGERWKSGRWSVAEEHLASQTLIRALDRIRPEHGPESRVGPLAVLAGVAGEQHALGLACLDQVLRDQGWTVANLGPDVPAADLAQFLARNHADLLALSTSIRKWVNVRDRLMQPAPGLSAAVRPGRDGDRAG
jgi:methanogenic corrinoid protein MtbC1